MIVRHQRKISRYLFHHLGHSVCISQHEIAKFGDLHVEFKQEAISADTRKYGVKKDDCFWRYLSEMIKIHAGEIYQNVEDIFDIEVSVVGDHGKG